MGQATQKFAKKPLNTYTAYKSLTGTAKLETTTSEILTNFLQQTSANTGHVCEYHNDKNSRAVSKVEWYIVKSCPDPAHRIASVSLESVTDITAMATNITNQQMYISCISFYLLCQ